MPSGPATTLWSGKVARSTHAAGVVGNQPSSSNRRVNSAKRSRPMRSTIVSATGIRMVQSPVSAASAVRTANDRATPRSVTGMPQAAGAAMAAGHAGDHDAIDSGVAAGSQFLEAATKHERVTALETDDGLSAGRVFDEQAIDRRLPRGPVPAAFSGVDDLRVRTCLCEQFTDHEAVVNHDVGRFARAPGRVP